MAGLSPTVRPECGTYRGAQAHARAGEDRCVDCGMAAAEYVRERRRTAGTGYYASHPVELRLDLVDVDTLGATIARGFRESA